MYDKPTVIKKLWAEGYTEPNMLITQLKIYDALKGCENVLDLGCGTNSVLRFFGFEHTTGVEGHLPSYRVANSLHTHNTLIFGDIRHVWSTKPLYDACVMLDVIEHLPKEDGLELLLTAEDICTKKVVVHTPSGFLPQRCIVAQDFQEHLSGWTPEEMRNYGYEVTGNLGWKSLRGEYHHLRYRPKLFWGMLSMLTQLIYTNRHPERAAAMLCVKTLRPMPG